MPAVQSGVVLISGASGYIAIHISQQLLEAGYKVKGTVRSSSKGAYLKKKLSEITLKSDNFEFVIVEDIEKPGAFDDAVKGVDAILHTASPFHYNTPDPEQLIGPAVQGTIGILKSALALSSTVKRVIVTSSTAAIRFPTTEPRVFDENDWNDYSPKLVAEKGRDTPRLHMYMASKSLAEKAAWELVEKSKPSFDLVTVNPTLVFGPLLHEVTSREALNTSIGQFAILVNGELKDASEEDLLTAFTCVDVRDAAKTHVLALQVEDAGGQRFASVSDKGGVYTKQDFADILHKNFPQDLLISKNAPIGKPGAGASVKAGSVSNERARKVLGQTFRSQEQTVIDTYKSLLEIWTKL